MGFAPTRFGLVVRLMRFSNVLSVSFDFPVQTLGLMLSSRSDMFLLAVRAIDATKQLVQKRVLVSFILLEFYLGLLC